MLNFYAVFLKSFIYLNIYIYMISIIIFKYIYEIYVKKVLTERMKASIEPMKKIKEDNVLKEIIY